MKMMKPSISSSRLLFFSFTLIFLLSQQAQSATTVLVDGTSEWKNPTVHVGDTIIFKHKYNHSLYIFRNWNAFNLCNFTQASLLTKPDSNGTSSYTWHPSRPGIFYFTFNNGSLQTCDASEKLSIKVSTLSSTSPPTLSPEKPPVMPAAAPKPASGGGVSSSPGYPWPFRPREKSYNSPSPAPISAAAATSPVPVPVPDKGSGIPFINSNPAVPLPTGEVDSATIRPLPTSGHVNRQVEVGRLASQTVLLASTIFLML